MRKIAKETGIEWPPEFDRMLKDSSWTCRTCLQAKLPTPNRLPPREEAKATRPFQRIYVDPIEITVKDWPMPSESRAQSVSSSDVLQRFPIQNEQGESPRYVLVIVDEYTRYCWVEVLYSKEANEIANAFTRWKITQVPISRELRLRSGSDYANETIPVQEILAIHSDFGTELRGDFDVMCRQGGYAHLRSPPYTQSKNGVVEGRINLLKQLIRVYAVEFGRCTESDYVSYATFAAMQLNLIHTRFLQMSPYRKLHGAAPNPEWLRPYGAEAYVRDYRPGSPLRGRRGLLVAITPGGMTFWFPDTGTYQTVHDAKFTCEQRQSSATTSDTAAGEIRSGELVSASSPHASLDPVTPVATSEPATAPADRDDAGAASEDEGNEQIEHSNAPAHAGGAPLVEQSVERPSRSDDPPERSDHESGGAVIPPDTRTPQSDARGSLPSPHDPSDAAAGGSEFRRPGEGARSEDEDQGISQDVGTTDTNADSPRMDVVPGRNDVGVEIPTLGDKASNNSNTQTPSDPHAPTPKEPTELRRSTRERRAPSRFVGATRIMVDDSTAKPDHDTNAPDKQLKIREEQLQRLLDDATVDVKRKSYGNTTKDMNLVDPIALMDGKKANELTAWLSTRGQSKEKITILDLCSGSHSLERALDKAGIAHLFTVISVDDDPSTNPTILMKVEELAKAIKSGKQLPPLLRKIKPALIWASPPCTPYTRAATMTSVEDRIKQMRKGDRCVEACLFLINYWKPMAWFLENPDAELANRKIMQPLTKFKHTVTYCNYGRMDQKATLIYTNLSDLNLLDCRRPGETCLAKTMLGHHLATAQAGPSKTADGTIIPGTKKTEAQKVPEMLIITILQSAFAEFGDKMWPNQESESIRTQVLAVQNVTDQNQLGRRVRDIAECGASEIKQAKMKELQGLIDRKVFEIVGVDTIDPGAPSLQPVWVTKVREDNTVKARLCAGGHRQKKGVNFWEISSPTPRSTSVKLALGIAATNRWEVNTADVSQAYVASPLGVVMYMKPPAELSEMGILRKNQTVNSVRLKLVKSLYGAKQSGRNWHNEVSNTLRETLGYHQSDKDPCVFFKAHTSWAEEGPSEIVILYVDDFLHLGRSLVFDDFMSKMKKVYDITASPKEQKIKMWNGLEISRRPDGSITVSQIAKIRDMGREFKQILDETTSSRKVKAEHPEYVGDNHFDPNDAIDPKTATSRELETLRLYQSMVGSALYVATYTRFDIAYALSKASRLMHCGSEKHVRGMARIIKYLVENEDLKLTFRPDVCTPHGTPRIFTFVDSDYAGEPRNKLDPDNLGRKSTSAIVIMAFGCAIFWKSKLQPVVATSTGEAEFRAMWLAVTETLFCNHFLHELGYEDYRRPLVPIFCDSNVGVSHAKRDGLSWLEGTKQYETQLSCVYQHCCRGEIVPIKIGGEHNPADLLSKSHIGTIEKCEATRRRICGHPSVEPFKEWMKQHLTTNFDGSSMINGGFVSLKDLMTKYGL